MNYDILPFRQQEFVFTSTLDKGQVDEFFTTYEAPQETLTCTHFYMDRDEVAELNQFFTSINTEEIYWLAKRVREFIDKN